MKYRHVLSQYVMIFVTFELCYLYLMLLAQWSINLTRFGLEATIYCMLTITSRMEVHIKGMHRVPSFFLQRRVTIVIINIIITATSPPITPT